MKKIKKFLISLTSVLSLTVITPMLITSCSNNNQQSQTQKPEQFPDNSKPNQNNSLEQSGTFRGLKINSYSQVIQNLLDSLNIDDKYNISSLNDQIINEAKSKNIKYNNLSIKLGNESLTNSKLVLVLDGTYENTEIKNKSIEITNFYDLNKLSNLFLSDFQINLNNWFNDLQPTDIIDTVNINNITSNDWINKYLLEANLKSQNNTNDVILMNLKQAISKDLSFELNSKVKSNKIFISTDKVFVQNKKYLNNQWMNDKKVELTTIVQPTKQEVLVPKNNDALNFVLNNSSIDEKILRNYYASYFKAFSIQATKLKSPFPTIKNLIIDNNLEKINNKYFPNNHLYLNITNDSNLVVANDFEPNLSFSLIIAKDGFSDIIASKDFNFNNKTKSLNSLSNVKENIIGLVTSDPQNWGYKIINSIKKIKKNEIDQFFLDNKNELTINNVNILNPAANFFNRTALFDNSEPSWTLENPNLLKIFSNISNSSDGTNGKINIFGKDINYDENLSPNFVLMEQDLNTICGLFKYDNNNTFMINRISYNLDNMINTINFYKVHNSLIVLTIPFKAYIECENKTLEQQSYLNINVTKSFWNSLN